MKTFSNILNFTNTSQNLQYAYKHFKLNGHLSLDKLKLIQRHYKLPDLVFGGQLPIESRPQNPESRNNPNVNYVAARNCTAELNLMRLFETAVNPLVSYYENYNCSDTINAVFFSGDDC